MEKFLLVESERLEMLDRIHCLEKWTLIGDTRYASKIVSLERELRDLLEVILSDSHRLEGIGFDAVIGYALKYRGILDKYGDVPCERI